jgi:non-heme chloroperoxidase
MSVEDSMRADRFQYLENYFLQHYCADQNLGTRVSAPTLRAHFASAATAEASAMIACVGAWQEDFRVRARPCP